MATNKGIIRSDEELDELLSKEALMEPSVREQAQTDWERWADPEWRELLEAEPVIGDESEPG